MEPLRQVAMLGAANDALGGDAAPLVNAEVIADLEALGSTPGFVDRLVRAFWNDNLRLIARLEAALGGPDLREFRNVLGTMRSAAAGMGAERLSGACRVIDRLSDAEIRLRNPYLAKSLRAHLEATHAALERTLQLQRKTAL